MKNCGIKSVAVALVIAEAITFNSCNIKGNEYNDSNDEVDENIYKSNHIINDRFISIDTNTFEDYNTQALANSFSKVDVYNISGIYLENIQIYKATILKYSIQDGYFLLRLNDGQEVVVNAMDIYESPILNTDDFYEITDNKNRIVKEFSYLYDKDGNIIADVYENFKCTAISTNGEYTLVKMGNNGNNVSKDKEGYLLNSELETIIDEVIETPTPEVNPWHDIRAYFYVSKNAYIFQDESFNNPGELVEAFQKVFVLKANNDWSYVMSDSGTCGYMEPYLLFRLPDQVFVEVDISDQTTKLYYNHEMVYSTSNVTGKDTTPTDIGYFDIDGKTKSTYLTSYRSDGTLEYSTYVDYWMPYNYGEGLHDAPWQNGHFGDTDWHHTGGSHGCVNMPSEAAEYIYDNVEIGTKVLVHK